VARVLVFDVMETLLDLRPLQEPFARAFGDSLPVGEWFARLLHGSLVATLTDTYEDFGTIGARALEAVAGRRVEDLPEDQREAILETMRRLPPHPEVLGALTRLRSTGFPWPP
jgi:2-haloacid dehalogenase